VAVQDDRIVVYLLVARGSVDVEVVVCENPNAVRAWGIMWTRVQSADWPTHPPPTAMMVTFIAQSWMLHRFLSTPSSYGAYIAGKCRLPTSG
jgi:hypothetical protein